MTISSINGPSAVWRPFDFGLHVRITVARLNQTHTSTPFSPLPVILVQAQILLIYLVLLNFSTLGSAADIADVSRGRRSVICVAASVQLNSLIVFREASLVNTNPSLFFARFPIFFKTKWRQ